MNITKLSEQTILELVELSEHFDLGVKILINQDTNSIDVVGTDGLDEEGAIHVERHYDFEHGTDDLDEHYDTSHAMITEMEIGKLVLNKADLSTSYEDAVASKENGWI